MRFATLTTTRRAAFAAALVLTATPSAAEPPERPGLTCQAVQLSAPGTLRLELAFSNTTAEPISLPPGAHLVLYRDAAGEDAMPATARVDRLQRTALVVPPNGTTTGLFIAGERTTAELLCNAGRPAVAGLYFYEFSPRPAFRCLLRGEAAEALPMGRGCARAASAPARP
ncbi:MAG: hypothetical protein IPM15_00990 [Betaproteobacteria bacterium]|nr:hypothetical protein [Betaproteobacteria bacterium]MCC6852857.1 hypothetical protein [Rubrivivax sp.]MCL4696448.1 hypothetical protein [Burkholderiaceae bacterium]